MEDWNKKAFDFAQESTKLVITLSTGVLALTITFMTDFAKEASLAARIVMVVSWLFYIASIVCGVLAMYTLTGKLTSQGPDEPSARGGSITVWSGGQLLAFVCGIVVTVVAGFIALI